MEEDDVAAVTTPEQFKALGHPMRHRLLFALGQGQATISQLAAALGSNKGNIAHHLKVLADAGLVRPAGTRQVRGGTEQYYQRASRSLKYHDAATTETAFRALAAEIAAAEPEPLLVLRMLRLTPEHARQLTATLRDLARQAEDTDDQPRYGLLLGLYQPAQAPPPDPAREHLGRRSRSEEGTRGCLAAPGFARSRRSCRPSSQSECPPRAETIRRNLAWRSA